MKVNSLLLLMLLSVELPSGLNPTEDNNGQLRWSNLAFDKNLFNVM